MVSCNYFLIYARQIHNGEAKVRVIRAAHRAFDVRADALTPSDFHLPLNFRMVCSLDNGI